MKEKVLFLGGKKLGKEILESLLQTDDVVGIVTNIEDLNPIWYQSIKPIADNNCIPYFAGNINVIKNDIHTLHPKFIICHGYDIIVKPDILSLVPFGNAINIHTGLIDQYRGRYPTVFPIIDGKNEAGITIHQMISDVDAGSVYGQSKVPVENIDTAKTLYDKCMGVGFTLFERLSYDIKSGKCKSISSDVSHSRLITKKDFPSLEMKIGDNPDKLDKMVRALTFPPFPLPYFIINGKKYEIHYKGITLSKPL